eukprot:c5531_g1_i1.p1 GENE.c5531_g1_i1~~c5531_g1_i1.p1  ORF type:complete len:133 (+),score=16.65 c5531_g1_i1:39-437(+)
MWEDRAEHQVRVDLLIGGFACFCIGLGLVSISWLISLGDFPDFKFTQCWVAEVTAQEYLPDTNLQVIQLTTETDEKLQYSVTTLCAEEENCLATVNVCSTTFIPLIRNSPLLTHTCHKTRTHNTTPHTHRST